jgi:hypothetical protein
MERNSHYKKLIFSFRILEVNSSELDEFNDYFKQTYGYRHKKKKDSDKFTIVLELNEKTDYAPLAEYILKHQGLNGRCGIYISLVTELDSDGLSVPDFVLSLLINIKGTLDFSFTTI